MSEEVLEEVPEEKYLAGRSEEISGKALHQWRQWAIQLATDQSIDLSEVDWFLQGMTPLSSLSLRLGTYQNQSNIALKASLETLTEKWEQRVTRRVPVQYLTGETPWRNFSLMVSPDVLIPRPETELIIDIASTLVEHSPIASRLRSGHWADLGTGSGAIALGLAHQFPTAKIHAVDISEKALDIAQQNAKKNALSKRITLHQGSWLTPLNHLQGQLSAIVSNPPYIPTKIVATLQPEVVHHEPHLALDGGDDGLDDIRKLIHQGAAYLHPSGLWLIELMLGQAESVADLLAQHGSYTNISSHQDLSGIQRFVSARKAI
ncbi:MAG: peptide chain release factor N(5)-glutamine methyltransferase [Cyanobacteria bacterium P01_F01_bin.86]